MGKIMCGYRLMRKNGLKKALYHTDNKEKYSNCIKNAQSNKLLVVAMLGADFSNFPTELSTDYVDNIGVE